MQIEIADTGTGLTPEESERLFTPYYTTKPQGTGLGLAIVQSVVSDHYGTISLASEEGRGTTARIILPQRQSEHAETAAEEAQPVHPAKIRAADAGRGVGLIRYRSPLGAQGPPTSRRRRPQHAGVAFARVSNGGP